jgi:hypothetical protein
VQFFCVLLPENTDPRDPWKIWDLSFAKHRFDKSVFLCFDDDESSVSFGCNLIFLNIKNCKSLQLSQLIQG